MIRFIHIAALVLIASVPSAKADDQWTWRLVPYALAPNIDGDAGIGRLTSVGLNVDPADIIDNLNLGAMILVEGLHHSGWGFMADYSFMELGDSGRFAGGAGAAQADLFQGILTAVAFKRVVNEPNRKLDVYGGLRWWQMDVDVSARLGPLARTVSVFEEWADPHIGLRYRGDFANSDWSVLGQADIGGFGLSSDFAWTAEAGFAWQATETFSLELTYKAIGVDYKTGTPGTPSFFAYDTITHGPKVGFAFEF